MQNSHDTIYCLFRNDDPCALSDPVRERKVLEVFAKHRIPQVLAVIPRTAENPHDCSLSRYHALDENPEMVELLKEYHAKGLVEIAQHGFTHQTNIFHPSKGIKLTGSSSNKSSDNKIFTRETACTEFSEFKCLSRAEKRSKIISGKNYLEELFNIKIETFIFPWNSFDIESLEILKECGIKRVLAGRDNYYYVKDLIVLYNSNEEILDLKKLQNDFSGPGKTKLFHLLYHSWLLTDDKIKELERVLSVLAQDERLKFIKTDQLDQLNPLIKKIARPNHIANRLGDLSDVYLKRLVSPAYYQFNQWEYLKKIIRGIGAIILKRNNGIRKTFKLIAALIALLITYEILKNHSLISIASFNILIVVFITMLLILFRSRWKNIPSKKENVV